MQGTMAQLQQSPTDIERWKKAQQNLLASQAAPALAARDLDALPLSQRSEMRRRYVISLLRECSATSSDRLLLDKNPTSTVSLKLLLRAASSNR